MLNAILAGAVTLSTPWLWNGLSTVKLCVRFQCPPYFTSARLPETFKIKPRRWLDRHSGYLYSKNSLITLFPTRNTKTLSLIPPISTYSSDSLGFRKHRPNSVGSNELATKAHILALGDSYTFGSEVDDLASWPAYLERASGKVVYNAGIGSFGSAQAVAHGRAISLTMDIDTVLFSVLVDTDIKRDRWVSRHGKFWSRPVVDRNSVLMHLPVYDAKAEWEAGTTHAEAASAHSIMDYVVQRLLKIPANKHVLLLQYNSGQVYHNPLEETLEERALWAKKARAWNIPLVDTFDLLDEAKDAHSPLWIENVFISPSRAGQHHTSYGNEIVAQAILDSGVLD